MFIVYGICDDVIPYGFIDTVYGEIEYELNTDRSEWLVPGTEGLFL